MAPPTNKMLTVNSLSGGKTSAYIGVHHPADYNVFALVRTDDKNCLFPDKKIRQLVSDKIGVEFCGTLEFNDIIYTMLDLEQFIGKKINWVTGKTFEELVQARKMLPNIMQRFCTVEMKINPIAQWCYENIELPVNFRFGFRANETRRAKNMNARIQEDGLLHHKFKIGKHKNGNNKWKTLPYYNPVYPLITDVIFKDNIEKYWKDKPVKFAYMNNCIGCFHRSEMLLKHISTKAPDKFKSFIAIEKLGADLRSKSKNAWGNEKDQWARFKKDTTYERILNHKLQLDLFDDDFNDCDSGYCGL